MERKKYYKTLYDLNTPGKCVTVKCTNHSYAWSGKIPCTGVRRCIYCGKIEETS